MRDPQRRIGQADGQHVFPHLTGQLPAIGQQLSHRLARLLRAVAAKSTVAGEQIIRVTFLLPRHHIVDHGRDSRRHHLV